jgi:hypothetical protein
MWYNGLQVNFNQRFSHGLVFTASYVRSRQIEQWGWMNQYLLVPQRSPYGFDHPNVSNCPARTTCLLVNREPSRWAAAKIADVLFGGWQIAPSLAIQNGNAPIFRQARVRLRNSHVQTWTGTSIR